MSIPEVRDRLYELADVLRSAELRMLADQLWRRPSGRRPVKPKSRTMSGELAERIRAYVAEHPDEPEDRVGDRFGVNQGRVSEALFGFRDGSTWGEP